jgi:hypothetical protein
MQPLCKKGLCYVVLNFFLFNVIDLALGLYVLQGLKLAALPPPRPGFDLRLVSVGYMLNKVALGRVFLQALLFSSRHCHSANVVYTFAHLPLTLCNLQGCGVGVGKNVPTATPTSI